MDYRWDIPWSSSIAFHRFRSHHIQLNNMYWSFYYGTAALGKDAAHSKKSGITSKEYFKFVVDSLEHPNFNTVENWENWESSHEEFENLTRINLLLDANSYFEVYLRSIHCLAMESRPDILLNRACVTDGFALYKNISNYHYSNKSANNSSNKYMFYDNLLSLTKKDWTSRNAAFVRIYGQIPKELEENRALLDEIRKIRNAIGHFFGRNINDANGDIELRSSQIDIIKLSDKRLKKFLDVIYKTAKAIDAFLFPNFIGSYESVLFSLQYAMKKSIRISQVNEDMILNGASTSLKKVGYDLNNTHLREALRIFFNT